MLRRIPAGITVAVLVGALIVGALIAQRSLGTTTKADQRPTRSSVAAGALPG